MTRKRHTRGADHHGVEGRPSRCQRPGPVPEVRDLGCEEAQVVIEAWRGEYNEERTHSAIDDVMPMEFIQKHQDRSRAARETTSLVLL